MAVMTYPLAMSAGRDAANRRMRAAGRTKWNRADYNAAVREFNRLYPKKQLLRDLREHPERTRPDRGTAVHAIHGHAVYAATRPRRKARS